MGNLIKHDHNPSPQKAKCIYLIDDEPTARFLLRILLEHQGHQCIEAEHGASALTFLQKGNVVDLVITDDQMPSMTGLEFLKKLPDSLPYPPPPVILYTGKMSEEVKIQALQHGAFAVLSKPYTFPEILHAVSQALGPQSSCPG